MPALQMFVMMNEVKHLRSYYFPIYLNVRDRRAFARGDKKRAILPALHGKEIGKISI